MSTVPQPIRPGRWGQIALVLTAVTSLASALAALRGVRIPSWVLGLEGSTLVLLIALGVAWQRSGIFCQPILSIRTARPELALTFDDGPHPQFTRPILDVLESRGHRGTFFVVGSQAKSQLELLSEIARRGHELANHSERHSYLTNTVPPLRLAEELRRTEALIETAGGTRTRWFRPPVGLLSPRVFEACRLTNMKLVAWTASARDGVGSRTVEDALRRLEPQIRPGAILVLHDGTVQSRQESIALPVLVEILDRMEARGLRSVTLDELLAPSPVR